MASTYFGLILVRHCLRLHQHLCNETCRWKRFVFAFLYYCILSGQKRYIICLHGGGLGVLYKQCISCFSCFVWRLAEQWIRTPHVVLARGFLGPLVGPHFAGKSEIEISRCQDFLVPAQSNKVNVVLVVRKKWRRHGLPFKSSKIRQGCCFKGYGTLKARHTPINNNQGERFLLGWVCHPCFSLSRQASC